MKEREGQRSGQDLQHQSPTLEGCPGRVSVNRRRYGDEQRAGRSAEDERAQYGDATQLENGASHAEAHGHKALCCAKDAQAQANDQRCLIQGETEKDSPNRRGSNGDSHHAGDVRPRSGRSRVRRASCRRQLSLQRWSRCYFHPGYCRAKHIWGPQTRRCRQHLHPSWIRIVVAVTPPRQGQSEAVRVTSTYGSFFSSPPRASRCNV